MKKFLSILLALCMIVTAFPCIMPTADAAATYSVSDAMAYAKAHWDDGKGLCAEFVSRCVIAGGIKMDVKTGTGGCWKAIVKATGLSKQTLKLNSNGHATKALNGDNLAAGDVVVQWCSTHSIAPHILICSGYNSKGVATYYAHNGAMNKQTYKLSVNTAYEHTTSCDMGGQVIRLSTLDPSSSNYGDADVAETTVINCRYSVTIPANYKLQCYQYPESTTKYRSISAQSSSYKITCTQKINLSSGGTRYFFISGDGYKLYFDYTSGMSVTTLHDYTTTYTSATCTAQGYRTKTCTCGYSYNDTYVAALGHDMQSYGVAVDATCTTTGVEITLCSRCSETGTLIIPAIGHSWASATCTAPNTCTSCGATDGAALGHNYVSGVCSRCGEKGRSVLLGDANGDSAIDNVDAMLILQYAVGLKGEDALVYEACDVDGVNGIDNVDAMLILQYTVGLLSSFPAAN